MEFFDKYTSATVAATSNQAKYKLPDTNVRVCRTYAKSEVTANTEFALLFGDTVDSTFECGDKSRANMVCGNWEIKDVRLGVASEPGAEPTQMKDTTINGKTEKKVSEGEVFWTDPVIIDVKKGEYFCVEFAFCGVEIPILFETVISSYIKDENGWHRDIFMPMPNMIGCARKVPRIAFWGDSITQGIGTEHESYSHYGAVVAGILGDKYAYWDLGLGYARGHDAATCGAWMNKAKQNDLVCVCFGVNDNNVGYSAAEIKETLDTIVDELKAAGKKVLIQSIPPFNFTLGKVGIWDDVNDYIRNVISKRCDAYFDNNPILCDKNDHTISQYGEHPDATGHRLWGKALAKVIKAII